MALAVTFHEEVSPMNAVSTWVLPSSPGSAD
jgi:hypothetical protein